MTPEQIRAEAIEKAAKAMFAIRHPGCDWDNQFNNFRKEFRAEAHAAIDAYEKAMWRPIEEAPPSGEARLVYAPGAAGLTDIQMTTTWHPDAGWTIDEFRDPTHFRPLPQPPEVT